MKVMIILPSLERSGTGQQVLMLSKALQSRGYSILVYAFEGGPLEKKFVSANIQVEVLSTKNSILSSWQRIFGIKSAAKDFKPSIIYSFLWLGNFYSALANIPDIKLIWGVRTGRCPSDNWKTKLIIRLNSLLSDRVSMIVCNSKSVAREFRQLFNGVRLEYVPNLLDQEFYPMDKGEITQAKKALGLNRQKIISVVSRLDTFKNQSLVIDSTYYLLKSGIDIKLCLFFPCMTEYGVQLEDRVSQLKIEKNVQFIENPDDLILAYNISDVLCMASRSGSMPNSLLEALLCGTVCVTTDVGDAAYMVDGCGFVGSFSAKEFSESVRKALELAEKTTRVERARIISTKYRNDNNMDLIEQLFDSI